MSKYTGQCLCGQVQYSVDKIEEKMGHCHCSMCRKFHGAAYATFGEAKAENFHWLAGKEKLMSYRAENGTTRQFCKQCGSSLTFQASDDADDVVEFALGTLDSDLDIFPDVHIYVGNKSNWTRICDGLPQYEGNRNSKRLLDRESE